jgi:hypothetical protein
MFTMMAEFRCTKCVHWFAVTTKVFEQHEDKPCAACGAGTMRAARLVGYRMRAKERAA